jgi:hypothetical protein
VVESNEFDNRAMAEVEQTGRKAGVRSMIFGVMIDTISAALVVLAFITDLGAFRTYALVIGFLGMCIGVSLMIHGALDRAKGR